MGLINLDRFEQSCSKELNEYSNTISKILIKYASKSIFAVVLVQYLNVKELRNF